MSIYDRLRETSAKLLEGTFRVDGTLVSVTRVEDRAAGRVTTSTVETPCVAIIGARKFLGDNGRLVIETVARMNVEPNIGDKLVVGTSTYIVENVEDKAPDGGEPMLWIAGLKA